MRKICLLILLGFIKVTALAGSASTAGGSVVTPHSGARSVFLDVFLENPNLIEPNISTTYTVSALAQRAGTDLFDPLENSSISALLNRKLDFWQRYAQLSTTQNIVNDVREVLHTTTFYITPYAFGFSPVGYEVPDDFYNSYPNAKIEPAIIYIENFGALISAPAWSRLGPTSQIAALVHETLRQLQISYHHSMSNLDLQKMTALLVLRSPSQSNEVELEKLWYGTSINTQELEDLLNQGDSLSQRLAQTQTKFPSEQQEFISTYKIKYIGHPLDDKELQTVARQFLKLSLHPREFIVDELENPNSTPEALAARYVHTLDDPEFPKGLGDEALALSQKLDLIARERSQRKMTGIMVAINNNLWRVDTVLKRSQLKALSKKVSAGSSLSEAERSAIADLQKAIRELLDKGTLVEF